MTNINELVEEGLKLSYHSLRSKDKYFNAKFQTELDANLAKINVSPQDLSRVIINLCNNAFYAVNKRKLKLANVGEVQNFADVTNYVPTVTISTQKTDNQVIIKVTDNGIGMSDEVKIKIFQPFFTTKPTGEGTGLGLSLSYDIITKGHGGTLDVESKEGEGTTFIIKLTIK